jgi:hypothetical protein
MRARVSSLPELVDKGAVLSTVEQDQIKAKLPFFLDAWELPVLYYKSSPGSTRIVSAGLDKPGIYRQEDNGVITAVGGLKERPGWILVGTKVITNSVPFSCNNKRSPGNSTGQRFARNP